MITTVFAKVIGGVLKEIHQIRYKNGSIVERTHSPGSVIPEDIIDVKKCTTPQLIMNQECEAYCHHYNVQL